MLDNFRKGAVTKVGVSVLNANWLILKAVKRSVERNGYGNKEVFALEKHCLLWNQNLAKMKSDGKKDKWFAYDLKVINCLLDKTGSLILCLKARQKDLDLSVFDDWLAYFDELEVRYKSKSAEVDFQALQDFLQTSEAKEGLAKWRSLKR